MPEINLYQIANDLNNMECDVHNKTVGAVVKDDDIVFKNPCCSEFEQQMKNEYSTRLEKQLGL